MEEADILVTVYIDWSISLFLKKIIVQKIYILSFHMYIDSKFYVLKLDGSHQKASVESLGVCPVGHPACVAVSSLSESFASFRNGKPSCWIGQGISWRWQSYELSGSLVSPTDPSLYWSQPEWRWWWRKVQDNVQEMFLENLCSDAVAEKLLCSSVKAASPMADMPCVLSWWWDFETNKQTNKKSFMIVVIVVVLW